MTTEMWRNLPITKRQKLYIKIILRIKMIIDFTNVIPQLPCPLETMTRGIASDYIKSYKNINWQKEL